MRFSFTTEQVAFRDAVRELLARECPAEVVRAAWPEGGGKGAGPRSEPKQVNRVWASLAEMGVLGLAVPEDSGGLGLTELDWVLVAEEAGYSSLPYPFVETVGVAAPLLAQAGDRGAVLGSLVSGELVIAAQFDESAVVPYAQRAEAFLIRRDGRAWLTSRTDADISLLDAVDGSRGLGVVSWDPDRSTLVGEGAAVDLAFDRGALGMAAQLVGSGRRMLDLTVGYVKERRQFGVPIGSFQAVKHHLADAALQLAFAAPAVHRAAHSLATKTPTVARDVSMAKVLAAEAALTTGRTALQCHGAIGYTVEYDLHLYLKRAWALARSWGDPTWHRARVGSALGVP